MPRSSHRVFTFPAVLMVGVALSLTGCARAKAKTVQEVPALEMPPPPPRDIEPIESQPPEPATLPQEPARNAPPRTRPAPAREQPRPAAPVVTEPPKPEPPPAEPPKPEEPAKPPPTLQTAPSAAEGEAEQRIRLTLARALNDLNRVDYRVLNNDARVQYDTAKSFITQAEGAIRAKNLVFARSVAEKAAAIAAQLGGR